MSTKVTLQNPKYQTCIDACCVCCEACEACCTVFPYLIIDSLGSDIPALLRRESIFASILFTITFVGAVTSTGEFSASRSKQQWDITVDLPVPGGPVTGTVPSLFILYLAAV